jgi:hypothetical protein
MVDIGEVSVKILNEIGQIGLWLNAAGFIFILWIIFQIISLIANRKKLKEIAGLRDDIKILDAKLNKVIKKKL